MSLTTSRVLRPGEALDRYGNVVSISDAARAQIAASLAPASSAPGTSITVNFKPFNNSSSFGWTSIGGQGGGDHGATPEVTPGTFEIETFTHNWLGAVLLIVAVYFAGRWIVKGKGRGR